MVCSERLSVVIDQTALSFGHQQINNDFPSYFFIIESLLYIVLINNRAVCKEMAYRLLFDDAAVYQVVRVEFRLHSRICLWGNSAEGNDFLNLVCLRLYCISTTH